MSEAPPIPQTLLDALDSLDREAQSLPTARALKQRQLSPQALRAMLRAISAYLDGDVEQAAQLFEALGDDLSDRTMSL